jgi:hypothetical protein
VHIGTVTTGPYGTEFLLQVQKQQEHLNDTGWQLTPKGGKPNRTVEGKQKSMCNKRKQRITKNGQKTKQTRTQWASKRVQAQDTQKTKRNGQKKNTFRIHKG